MASKYDEYEASKKLDDIAEKFKELDRLLQAAYPYFDQDIMAMIEEADPKNDMDPGYWSKKIKNIADTVLNERLDKDETESLSITDTVHHQADVSGPSF